MSVTSLLNVIANGFSVGSLEYLSLTMWQIARASELVFVAFFSVTLLRKPLYIFHAMAIVLTIGSFLLVSWSQMQAGGSNSDLALGLAMSLTARLFAALVGIVSQMLLQDLGMSAMRITGIQGAISTVLCLVLVLPVAHFLPGSDDGRVENVIDGLEMLNSADAVLLSAIAAVCFTEIFYLWLRLEVINQSSAVFYGLTNMMRSPATFVALLGAYYIDPALGIGEPWGPRSYMIVLGLVGMLLAQLIFAERVRFPGLRYPENPSELRLSVSTLAAAKEGNVFAAVSEAHGDVEKPHTPLQCYDPNPVPPM
jgi:drug/metabolite transporter (DMT)-like permease